MTAVHPVSECRMCGNKELVIVVDLGIQYLTGVFPTKIEESTLTKGPLRLVKCHGEDGCGLLQLDHSYDLEEMYGENYGYRSGLNANMVKHLKGKIDRICRTVELKKDDLVVDIGSNDGTSLGFYPDFVTAVGVDPSGGKFREFYKPHIQLIEDFFDQSLVERLLPAKKAKVITSFSMLYDLEDPLKFVRDISNLLDEEEGIWVSEQSYLPTMIEKIAFDTICHEHLEYYSLKQLNWLAEKAGMKIVAVDLNDVNGGSISVVMAKSASRYAVDESSIRELMDRELTLGIEKLETYQKFASEIEKACTTLRDFVEQAKREGKTVYGLGASTKGNVLLQYCRFTDADFPSIGDVNPDKFGALTPGTWIKIESERKLLDKNPDYLVVLPWHFRSFFLNNPNFKGQTLVFPLPKLEICAL